MLKNISVAITFYNSMDYIQDALFIPLMDPHVDEVLIFDDGSERSQKRQLAKLISNLSKGEPLNVYSPRKMGYLQNDGDFLSALEESTRNKITSGFTYLVGSNWKKIRIIESKKNLGAYLAKHEAVLHSKSDWVLLLDSDNHLIDSSLDGLFSIQNLSENEMYFANVALMNRSGNFPWDFWNFRKFGYAPIGLSEVKQLLLNDEFGEEKVSHLLNNGNMLVNREKYLDASSVGFDFKHLVSAKDASLFSACWLANGNKIRIAPSYMYFHRLHGDSYWMRNLDVPKLSEAEIIALVESKL